MPETFPNQRIISIHRERATSDFLGIKNSHWQAAARDLGAHALMLYLYLASNADTFTLALSPAAIRQAIGMPASTYRDQFVKLVDRGYLVQRGEGSTYDFYEIPKRGTCAEDGAQRGTLSFMDAGQGKASPGVWKTAQSREINKINKTNNIINSDVKKQVSSTPQEDFFRF